MKKIAFQLLLLLLFSNYLFSQVPKELVVVGTGYGFDRTASNGVNPGVYSYFQKWAGLTYNGQDASPTAVRLHIQWDAYEPTLGNYHGTKLAQAMAALVALKPGLKIALHFAYQRPGPQPGQASEGYLADNEIARIYDGTKAEQTITYTLPSMFSQSAKTKFLNYVSNAMASISAYYSNILYVEMGNGDAEEFIIPIFQKNGYHYSAMYEDAALQAWRTEYLPCRYPGQSTVTWNGTSYNISSAPAYAPAQWAGWDTEHGREYHRFASWELMRTYKAFRDVVKGYNSSIKVMMFEPGFGTGAGNIQSMHNSILPMSLTEFDGIYSTDGGQNDTWRKILPLDVMKGTNPNKLAGIEFDPDDLGQQQNPKVIGIYPNVAAEWIPRAYKHGADYVHFAMSFADSEIDQLAPVIAALRPIYLNGSYQSPARQPSQTVNIYPTSFTGNHLFDGTWNNMGANNWSSTDLSPKSINMIDDGYWQNIWSCTPSSSCDFNITASSSNANPSAGASITLSSQCTGSNCSGLTYSWSGNGISGSNSSVSINAPNDAGVYTYTVTASKENCTSKTATVQITVGATCDFNVSATSSPSTTTPGSGASLSYSCSGANCSGITYAWSGNSVSGSSSPLNITVPGTAGTYIYTITASKSGCTAKTDTTQIVVNSGGSNPCGFTNGATIGTWQGSNVQARQFTVNGTTQWLIVTVIAGSSTDKHFPRGANFAGRTDISWSGSAPSVSCFGGGETAWGGLSKPSGITVPSGYTTGTEPDGAEFFQQTCTPPSAPSLSASPSSITTGSSSTLTATGCSGGTITWSHSLGTGSSKTVSPSSTTTYTATCSIGSCTSSNGSTTVTVTPPSGINCNTLLSDVNGINCLVTEGWVYDQSNPNTPVVIDIYEGSTLLIGNYSANKFRQDLLNAGYGNGNHAWEINTPSALKDGQTHTVTFKVAACPSYQVSNSPYVMSGCSNLMLEPDAEIAIQNRYKGLLTVPNPSSGVFESRFYLEKGKKATLVVTDLTGRTIFRKQITGQGNHKEQINLTGKTSGTLLVKLHKENGVDVKKVIIAR